MLLQFTGEIPPFITVKLIPENAPGQIGLPNHAAFLVSSRGETALSIQSVVSELWEGIFQKLIGKIAIEFPSYDAADLSPGVVLSKQLNISLVRELVQKTVSSETQDFLDGVQTIYLVHPSALKQGMVQIMAKLPFANSRSERRLLSVPCEGRNYAFSVEAYQLDLPKHHKVSPGWLAVLLFNPREPLIELQVPERGALLTVDTTLPLGDSRFAEEWAMEAVASDLKAKDVAVDYVHEPNGDSTFPDFEAVIQSVEWSVEVTCVLGGITDGRHIKLPARNREAMIDRAAQSPPIDGEVVAAALEQALVSKRERASLRKPGTKYCLLLVNVIDLDVGKSSKDWDDKDLSAFDAVVMVHCNPRSNEVVEYIKGDLI